MSDDWLEITDREINAQEIMQRIRGRMSQRAAGTWKGEPGDPVSVTRATRQEMLGAMADDSSLEGRIATWLRDCDVVPRNYVIDWRMPILGPIHALVRRVINAEIRRYLLPMLEKQSYLNREVLRGLTDLARENARLRQEIERLRGAER